MLRKREYVVEGKWDDSKGKSDSIQEKAIVPYLTWILDSLFLVKVDKKMYEKGIKRYSLFGGKLVMSGAGQTDEKKSVNWEMTLFFRDNMVYGSLICKVEKEERPRRFNSNFVQDESPEKAVKYFYNGLNTVCCGEQY